MLSSFLRSAGRVAIRATQNALKSFAFRVFASRRYLVIILLKCGAELKGDRDRGRERKEIKGRGREGKR